VDVTESMKEVIEESLKAMRYMEIGRVVAERLKRRHNRDIINDDAQYKKFIQNHKKEKENAEKGLHEFINGNTHEFEIAIEIKSKKHKIDLLQHEVEAMVKMMLGFRYNPEPAVLKVSNYEELGKKESE
jgi:hypothetical protein